MKRIDKYKDLHKYIKKEKRLYYTKIILASIFLVECVIMLGIVLSAIWYIKYGI